MSYRELATEIVKFYDLVAYDNETGIETLERHELPLDSILGAAEIIVRRTEEADVLAKKIWTIPDLDVQWEDNVSENYPNLGEYRTEIIDRAAEKSFQGLSDCQDWEWDVLDSNLIEAAEEIAAEKGIEL